MKKGLFFILLFVVWLWPDSVLADSGAVMDKFSDWKPSCSEMDEQTEKELDELKIILKNEDWEQLQDRLNNLMGSQEKLAAEKAVVDKAACYTIHDSMIVEGAFNIYHSLLTYAETVQDEDETFEGLTIERNKKTYDSYYDLNAVLSESGKEVHIDHFFSSNPGSSYLGYEVIQSEEALKRLEDGPPELAVSLTLGVAEQAYKALQNPIEKAISLIEGYFISKAEKEREIFRTEASIPPLSFHLEFSIIEIDPDTTNQQLMKEYYPTIITLDILERWETIHQVNPSKRYPKEAIENEDWNKVAAELREYRSDFSIEELDVYEYILNGNPTEEVEMEYLDESN